MSRWIIKENLDFHWESNRIKCLIYDSKIWLQDDVFRCGIDHLDSQRKDRLEHSKINIIFLGDNVRRAEFRAILITIYLCV